MKTRTFLFASLCAISLSLMSCGGNNEEPATMDTAATTTEPAPSATTTDTMAPTTMPVDTAASGVTIDTASSGVDTAAHK